MDWYISIMVSNSKAIFSMTVFGYYVKQAKNMLRVYDEENIVRSYLLLLFVEKIKTLHLPTPTVIGSLYYKISNFVTNCTYDKHCVSPTTHNV